MRRRAAPALVALALALAVAGLVAGACTHDNGGVIQDKTTTTTR